MPDARPVPDPTGPAALELDVLARWAREDTFRQSLDARRGAPHFVFYEGPPTANGKPGIHHVMARTVKDLFCRYKTMQGFRVDRKAGWDTHGLPVEIEVEKELGLKGRDAVEAYGIARFNAACRASVLRYKDLWDALTVRMGYWVDLDAPYVTFETDYVESVWNLLKRISERTDADGNSLLARGHRIQWYSPANGTVLSSHEVSLGYKEVQDVSATVRFPVEGEPGTSILAWTTTPWTLPSNAALAVHPRTTYARVRLDADGETEHVWIAEALVGRLKGDAEIVERRTGADLVGTVYVPPYHFAGEPSELYGLAEALAHGPEAHVWRVVAADYVTTEDGTGIVHTAPAFGADDWATGQKEGLPTLNPIAPDGTFRDGFPLVGGLDFKAADRPILRDLKERGLLYREDSYVHNYPHDWRRGTPLMQYPVESWFARTTAVKDRMVELNKTVNWQPEGIGAGRFGQWLDNNVDWALSRMRFWGTPLPIWVSDRDPDQVEVVGSVAELREKAGGAFPPEAVNPDTGALDLHRPYVDAVTWPDGHGGTMRRVPDLLDVWFDSGAMPWAQWHAPFENEDAFNANTPADFIAEGVDQTRGWFYTLHAIAALVDDRVAYRNVVVNGLVLDADGQKMSKSVGNTVDPFEAIERHGADAVRWTMMSASPPWENLKYSDEAVLATRRKLFGTLTNTHTFYATYAALDGYTYSAEAATPAAERTELDRWILSRLQSTIAESTAALDAYHPTRAARAVEAFVDDLSNWYLRRSRRRFWGEVRGTGYEVQGANLEPRTLNPVPASRAAYDTLHECLAAVARLMAPTAPFTAEWLHGALGSPESVHLARWPQADAARLDAALEGRMALARAVVTATLALRHEAGMGVRQPLRTLTVVVGPGGVDEAALRAVEAVVLDEVNVKRLDAASGGVVSKTARPNFKVLGRRLGPQMKAVTAAVRELSSEQIEAFEAAGRLVLNLGGETVDLVAGDLDVVSEGVEGRPVRQETALMPGGASVVVTVALDTALDDALRAEGAAREFVNRVQNLRKEAGFAVSDRIALAAAAPPALADALRRHAATIQAETLALTFETAAPGTTPPGEAAATADIGGETVAFAVRRTAA